MNRLEEIAMSVILSVLIVLTGASPLSVLAPDPGDFCGITAGQEFSGAPDDVIISDGWTTNLNSPTAGYPYTPVLCDVDGDGACEIFLTGGETFGLDGTDGSFLPGWPTQEMTYMGYASTGQLPGPSAADMNGDGVPEIMWSTRDWYAGSSHLWTFNGRAPDGNDLSGFPFFAPDDYSNALSSPFVLGDSDGDGQMEAVTAHTLGNNGDYYRISGVDYDGNLLFTTDLDTLENILDVYFGDVDGNGSNEFFAVTLYNGSFRLHLFNTDGSHQAGYPVTIFTPGGGSLMFGPPIPADLDGDGDLEIVLGYRISTTSYAVAVNHDGSVVPGFPITIATGSQLFYLGMGDITGDGNPELLAMDNELSADYRVWAIDMSTGTPLSGWPVYVSGWPKGFPTVADLDNDGYQDVSFTTDDARVHAIAYDGTELSGFPKVMTTTATSGTVVGDVDGDGLYEIVCASWDGWVYCWNTDGVASDDNRDWPMRGVDAMNTGVYRGSGGTGIGEATAPAVAFSVEQNPVTSSAVFRVTGLESSARIEIFDVTGRLVDTVSDVWSPGEDCSSGVYFARLAGSQLRPVKFVLIR